MAYTGKKPTDFVDVTQTKDFTVTEDLTVDTNTLYVDSTNNKVGIGTTSPTGSLDVASSGSHEVVFRTTTTGDPTLNLQADGQNNGKISYSRATEGLIFSNSGSERMRILSSGGITFNGDTSTANALDDYEEGTWTPTYGMTGSAATITHLNQTGYYRKVGSTVWIWGRIFTNGWSGGSGNVVVNGLPFTASGASSFFGSVHFSYVNAFGTNSSPSVAYIATGGNRFQPIKMPSSDGRSGMNTALFTSDMSNVIYGNDLIFAGSYIAS